MSEECENNCASCGENCSSRRAEQEKPDFSVPLNAKSRVHKVVAVVSGKGGVGKSLVTALLAAASRRAGFSTAVLDADVTGPSIPKSFGIKEYATGTEEEIYPVTSRTGIEVMSMNLLLAENTDPVVWRGPILANTVKQFWTEVVWGDIENMFVDLPPGTGDVPLTVFQSLPVNGIVIVTSPQDMVSMIVEKAMKMAKMMDIPIIGIVENMSYFRCPDCGKEHNIFGKTEVQKIADKYGISAMCRLPLDPAVAAAVDAGEIEFLQMDELNGIIEAIKNV